MGSLGSFGNAPITPTSPTFASPDRRPQPPLPPSHAVGIRAGAAVLTLPVTKVASAGGAVTSPTATLQRRFDGFVGLVRQCADYADESDVCESRQAAATASALISSTSMSSSSSSSRILPFGFGKGGCGRLSGSGPDAYGMGRIITSSSVDSMGSLGSFGNAPITPTSLRRWCRYLAHCHSGQSRATRTSPRLSRSARSRSAQGQDSSSGPDAYGMGRIITSSSVDSMGSLGSFGNAPRDSQTSDSSA
jgi:hypothetical protein